MLRRLIFIQFLLILPFTLSCSKGRGNNSDSIMSLGSLYSLDDLSNLAKNSGKITTYTTSGSENGLISMGDLTACVVMTSGQIKCWGYNQSFQLGNSSASTNNQAEPVYVNILTEKAVAVSAALNHTCAYLISGMKCWGSQNNGKLGNRISNTSYASMPQDILNLNSNQIKMMVTGDEHVCVLLSGSQQVFCWGLNDKGQVAQPFSKTTVISGINIQIPESVKHIATSDHSMCAITISGNLYCWGSYITTNANPNPKLIDSGVKNISSGEKDHFCYISANDFVNCFGRNDKLQLGKMPEDPEYKLQKNTVQNLNNVSAIVAGAYHSCAISDNNTSVYCWGDNSKGQLGNDDLAIDKSSTPIKVVSLPNKKIIDIASSDNVTCVLLESDDVFCWGNNSAPVDNLGDFLGIKNPPNFSNKAIKILNRNDL